MHPGASPLLAAVAATFQLGAQQPQSFGEAAGERRRLAACSPRGVFGCRIANAQIWALLHGAKIADWPSAGGGLFVRLWIGMP